MRKKRQDINDTTKSSTDQVNYAVMRQSVTTLACPQPANMNFTLLFNATQMQLSTAGSGLACGHRQAQPPASCGGPLGTCLAHMRLQAGRAARGSQVLPNTAKGHGGLS